MCVALQSNSNVAKERKREEKGGRKQREAAELIVLRTNWREDNATTMARAPGVRQFRFLLYFDGPVEDGCLRLPSTLPVHYSSAQPSARLV